MKELTSYNRMAGYLNKVFDLLNAEFFENALSRPTITIQSTPRAYGHFSLREDTWVSKLGGTHEINIGAGTVSYTHLDVYKRQQLPTDSEAYQSCQKTSRFNSGTACGKDRY